MLKQELETMFDNITIRMDKKNQLELSITKDGIMSVLSFLKNKGYDHLHVISCVDWIDDKQLELVYILSAYMKQDVPGETEQLNILLKTRIGRDDPKYITSIALFPAAEPYEREIHEMFGVDFQGHPRLTPLLLERDYDIPPFRKDFDTKQYVDNVFGSVPSVEGEDDS
ncbi:NADH-quinone oxidoreductase subunit C [Candidatus Fermentibacteria bacterium]|nr:MAG: NADH-quinone oxidoreductase subunit C [Candidatus Fermentibacteria bacterium]